MSQIRPVEVIQEKDVFSSTLKMIKNSPISPTITNMTGNKVFSAHKTKMSLINLYFKDKPLPKVLEDLTEETESTSCQHEYQIGSDLAF
jgi:hypothetical protein